MNQLGMARTVAAGILLAMGLGCGSTESPSPTEPTDVTTVPEVTADATRSLPDGVGPGDGATVPRTNADVKRALLTRIDEEVIAPLYHEIQEAFAVLESATNTYAQSLNDADEDGARDAWIAAMDLWQEVEALQIGPVAAKSTATGALGIRDEIYSWPLSNLCRVDQEIVEGNFTDADAFASEAVNVRGLDALEYLLFHNTMDNACKTSSGINKNGTWDALGEDGVRQNRADYAHTLAQLLAQEAEGLVDAWSGSNGFGQKLADAGLDGSPFGTAQEALNEVSNALFYIDTAVKDMKLAQPAGLKDCNTDTCPEELESLYAHRSREHVLANLRGAHKVLFGGDEALGFDDLLASLGADDLATALQSTYGAATASVEALDGSFSDILAADPQQLVQTHTTLKGFTDLLKTQFLTVLDLELPMRAEGDND